MSRSLRIGFTLLAAGLVSLHSGCFYKSTDYEPPEPYRPYYEGMATGSPWYGFPYGPPGWYPSDVQLGGGRLGGRY